MNTRLTGENTQAAAAAALPPWLKFLTVCTSQNLIELSACPVTKISLVGCATRLVIRDVGDNVLSAAPKAGSERIEEREPEETSNRATLPFEQATASRRPEVEGTNCTLVGIAFPDPSAKGTCITQRGC